MFVHPTRARRGRDFSNWGERLTSTRDIALVVFGGVYAFGYLARALHA